MDSELSYRRRLDVLLDGRPASRRPVLAARIGRLRAILIAASGAALEMQVSALLGRMADAGAWLDEAPLATAAGAPAPLPAPPAILTGTAAPR